MRTYPARIRAIVELSDWLRCEQVELVVMEATGDYWKPPFYLLEDEYRCWLLNARQVKHLPRRPKTDREDSIWLAKVAERGMVTPSFQQNEPLPDHGGSLALCVASRTLVSGFPRRPALLDSPSVRRLHQPARFSQA